MEFHLDQRGLSLSTRDDAIVCCSYYNTRTIPPLLLELIYRPTLTKLQAELAEHALGDAQPGSTSHR